MVRSVKLNAFTDDVDTLAEENEYNFFYQGFQKPISGDIFFFEDPETDQGDGGDIGFIADLADELSVFLDLVQGYISADRFRVIMTE